MANTAFGDSLAITGNPGFVSARTTYLVGATQDAGRWVIDRDDSEGAGAVIGGANGDEMTVNFTGLEPADDDTPAAIFDVIMNGAANNASIVNGGLLSGADSLQITDNNATFETTRFANKTTARIMGPSGGDTFTVNYTTAAAGLTTLELDGYVAAGARPPTTQRPLRPRRHRRRGDDQPARPGAATVQQLRRGHPTRRTTDPVAGTVNITGGETAGTTTSQC